MSRPDTRATVPLRLLHPLAAVMLIVGVVVGAGIFKTPALVAGISGDAGWALVLWLAGALISICGALCYAELCTAYPHAGGDYHFLHRAFGRHISFMYAWSKATVINTGSIALLAFVFGDYMSSLLSLGEFSSAWWALAVVLAIVGLMGNPLLVLIAVFLPTAFMSVVAGKFFKQFGWTASLADSEE